MHLLLVGKNLTNDRYVSRVLRKVERGSDLYFMQDIPGCYRVLILGRVLFFLFTAISTLLRHAEDFSKEREREK